VMEDFGEPRESLHKSDHAEEKSVQGKSDSLPHDLEGQFEPS
jgi:hypothetical protein